MPMGRPRGACPPTGLAAWRPAGVHDASERRSQDVCLRGCYLFALSRTKKALRRDPGAFVMSDGFLFWRDAVD
jgi:hypothetical protein